MLVLRSCSRSRAALVRTGLRSFSADPHSEDSTAAKLAPFLQAQAKRLGPALLKARKFVLNALAHSITDEERSYFVPHHSGAKPSPPGAPPPGFSLDSADYSPKPGSEPQNTPVAPSTQSSPAPKTGSEPQHTPGAPVVQSSSEPDVLTPLATETAVIAETVAPHPVFGKLIADLGFKRLYLAPLDSLARAPIWQRNRAFRPDRAEAIAKSLLTKAAQQQGVGLPGVITMFKAPGENGNLGIIDGQHRIGAAKILAEIGAWDPMTPTVVVEVFEVETEAQASALFTDINKAEPVRLVDLPEGGADDNVRKLLDAAVSSLAQRYSEMFSSSSRCHAPHLNVDVLRDDLFRHDVMQRLPTPTASALLDWILEQNAKLAELDDEDWRKILGKGKKKELSAASMKALNKAKLHGLFLGLDQRWLIEK